MRNSSERETHNNIFLNRFRPRYLMCKNKLYMLRKFNASNHQFIRKKEQ
jgi:hypothetical protein